MALYIQTNYASMVAQNNLSSTQNLMQTTFQRLSSGYRINSAADDAAGLGIAESMNAQVRSFAVAERNANDGISMAQVADGAAGQVSSIMQRLRELAVQSSNGDLTTSDRTNLDTEFQSLLGEIDRISQVTQFNGTNLLAGAGTPVAFQVGINTTANDRINITIGGVDTTQLGVTGIDVTSFANAQTAITALDSGLQALSTVRTNFGTAINQLQGAVSNLQSQRSNMSASLGRIRDVDVATETAQMAKFQVLSQAGISVLAQANQSPQLALSLLKGG
ncbi:MAG: flagellin [Polyangiaceae bacterium]